MDATSVRSRRYVSHLGDWHTKATVRAAPRRVGNLDESTDLLYSPSLVPVLSDPVFDSAGTEELRAMLARRLLMHLLFTIDLEQRFVNPTLVEIADNCSGIELPAAMRSDAYKIYCDEAYHAQFSSDLIEQVENSEGISTAGVPRSQLAYRLASVSSSATPSVRSLLPLFFTIVSETLISGTLSVIPEDLRVAAVVRETIADHARDERTHHAYFARFFEETWAQIDAGTQAGISAVVPSLISAFLEPDWRALVSTLMQQGYSSHESVEIVKRSYTGEAVQRDVMKSSRATVSLFRKSGVELDFPVSCASLAGDAAGKWQDDELGKLDPVA